MKIHRRAILPIGYLASGVASGIKRSGKRDLALLYSNAPGKAACHFTSNTIIAAPIRLNRIHLKKTKAFQAVIINSGNANCFTGKKGFSDAERISGQLSLLLKIPKESILSASTGIIGRRLPASKMIRSLPGLIKGLSQGGIDAAKDAILTTDTFAKAITAEDTIGGSRVRMCGIAKGAGMIAPNVATMLAFVLTDAHISQKALSKASSIAVNTSFNCITVDGCMSTNDTVAIMANSQACNALIGTNRYFGRFLTLLSRVYLELAKMIIKDAEGATKFIQIRVTGARSFKEARQVALSVANSNLFKTAIYGENHNFGRIAASVGSSGVKVAEQDVKISVSPLHRKTIDVEISLRPGKHSAVVYTSDLTPQYIKINAEYN
ncbi:MAG: bifunctional glutamate N-acetyltransferase/amino-acid acetyltransferase ArgJ [Candidatus Omnitrophota bacterium]|jgi:glutamate N-acetyltransferase/amino-acid N-acetyltransferase|nr:MAG: bifunctional glutamate N-acetyltransferase/amino-acid acetyltransferase ArgJ [Candidatus Omnitrophota bacterium]